MRVIVGAGGTGGHLYPALALVEYIKEELSRKYAILDGGMNDYVRVAMYEAYKNVFIYADRGVGNAMVMILLLMILVVVFVEFKFVKTKD